jgi:hypothetical protein
MMVAAAMRGFGWLALQLAGKPDMQQYITTPVLDMVLLQLLTQPDSWLFGWIGGPDVSRCDNAISTKRLLQLRFPAAAQISSESTAALLQACVRRSVAGYNDVRESGMECMDLLFELQGARELSSSSEFVAGLLHLSLEPHPTNWILDANFEVFKYVYDVAAPLQLSSAAIAPLLHVAVRSRSPRCMQLLLDLQGAHELSSSSEVMAGLLRAAMEHVSSSCQAKLQQLPAVQQLSSSTVEQLLLMGCAAAAAAAAAVTQSGWIWDIPFLQQIGVGVASSPTYDKHSADLYRKAADAVQCIGILLGLPAVQGLSTGVLVEPLRLTVELDIWYAVRWLCDLPAAKHFAGEVVQAAMRVAVVRGDEYNFNHLCTLPAAQQLDSGVVAQLLVAAAEKDRRVCLKCLSKLPQLVAAFEQLDPTQAVAVKQALRAAESALVACEWLFASG